MTAPEREYRYRLYTTPGVTCGPEVAEFLILHSEGSIRFEDVGTAKALFHKKPPFNKEAVEISNREVLFGDDFSVVLVNEDLAQPLFWYSGYAVVSRGGLKVGLVKGLDLPIYAYLTLLAIVGAKLRRYMAFPLEQAIAETGPHGWLNLIQSGQLPTLIYQGLHDTRSRFPELKPFIPAVERVLKAIAMNSSGLYVASIDKPDTSQQAPPKQPASISETVDITSDAEIKGTAKSDEPPFSHDIYVIHSGEDRERVEPLVKALQEQGWSVRWDLKISPGKTYNEVVTAAAFGSRCSIVVWSVNSISSLHVHSEANIGLQEGKLLPVMIDDVTIPLEFMKIQTVNLVDWQPGIASEEFAQLIAAMESIVRHSAFLNRPDPPLDAPSTPIGAKVAAAMSEYEKPVDVLGYKTYADALGDLITHPDTQTPITIAVCGPWGSGKTTLMNYIKDRIDEVSDESETEFIPLDFDAWTYSKSDAIWAPFYSAVLKGIESSLGFWGKRWFRLAMRFKSEPAKTVSWTALFVVSLAITVALTHGVLTSAPSAGKPEATELKQVITVFEPEEGLDSTATLVIREPKGESSFFPSLENRSLEGIAGAATSLFALVAALVKILTSVSAGVLGKVKKSGKDLLPLAQEDVVRYVKNVEKWLEPRLNGGKRKRFVVFVDDIDRVEPPKIMQMMEAIQLFLRTPGFVFVLGMDARVVRQAIGEHYRFMGKAHGGSEWWGHHYLEKIIQIPFYLPKIDKKGMNNLKEKLLGSFVAPPESIEEPTPLTAPLADKERTEPRSDSGETEPEPSEAKTDSADQTLDQSETSKPTPSPDATPTVDDRMVMTLTVEEDSAFDELFEDGLEMAPRLMVRLKNVYLLSRHVYLRSVPESQAPQPVFTKWIALSVKYPFDAKKLVETCTNANWPDTWEEVIDHYLGQARPIFGKSQLEKDVFGELTRFLDKHIESPKQIEAFVSITNCFNLVLE